MPNRMITSAMETPRKFLSFMSVPGCLFQQCSLNQRANDDHLHPNFKSAVVVSKEGFDSLPEDEQNRIYNELYGTENDDIEESEKFVEQKLWELDNALETLPVTKKKAFLRALEEEEKQSTDYVRNKGFRLMFLRAELFDVGKAAVRLALFFEEKEELFGTEKLVRRITQEDLSKDDIECLLSGFIYIAKDMDHMGRTVVLIRRCNVNFKSVLSCRRAVYYYYMSSAQDDEVMQKKGTVFIDYAVDCHKVQPMVDQRDYAAPLKKLGQKVIPIRKASFHHCFNDYRQNFVISMFMVAASAVLNARYTQHFGSHHECCAELLMYGVLVDLLPVNANGIDNMSKFVGQSLYRLRQKEEAERIVSIRNKTGIHPNRPIQKTGVALNRYVQEQNLRSIKATDYYDREDEKYYTESDQAEPKSQMVCHNKLSVADDELVFSKLFTFCEQEEKKKDDSFRSQDLELETHDEILRELPNQNHKDVKIKKLEFDVSVSDATKMLSLTNMNSRPKNNELSRFDIPHSHSNVVFVKHGPTTNKIGPEYRVANAAFPNNLEVYDFENNFFSSGHFIQPLNSSDSKRILSVDQKQSTAKAPSSQNSAMIEQKKRWKRLSPTAISSFSNGSDSLTSIDSESDPVCNKKMEIDQDCNQPIIKPLSAYNYFFADERDKFLSGESEDDIYNYERKERLLLQHLQKDRLKRRNQRKGNGKVDFLTLSRIIGQRWKTLPKDKKKFYHEIATMDKERYRREMMFSVQGTVK